MCWPISVGSRTSAEKCLLKSVELSPDYPDNQLVVLESYLKWDEPKAAKTHLDAATKVLEGAAREKFSGPEWSRSWIDWDRRWKRIKARFAKEDR